MALTPDLLSEEDDNNEDCRLDDEEIMHPLHSTQLLAAVDEVPVTIAARTAPLSREALHVLQLAANNTSSVFRQSPIIRPLFKQLETLRARVRSSTSDSCVIADALDNLEFLRKEAQRLRAEKNEIPESPKTIRDLTIPIVQVTPVNYKLHIHVSCPKGPGLIADLLESLEGLGAILDEVNVTCDANLVMDAQVEGIPADEETVRRVKHLLRRVCQ